MARVNLEEKLFARSNVRRAAAHAGAGFTESRMIGALALIWHDSQDNLQTECTAEEIVAYARDVTPDEAPRFVSSLVKTHFLVPRPSPGVYEINGNDKQIEGLVAASQRAKKGGEALQKKWRERKEKSNDDAKKEDAKPVSGEPQACPEQAAEGAPSNHNSIQFNAIQFNAEIENTPTSSDPPPPSTSGAPLPQPKKFKFTEHDMAIAAAWASWSKTVSKTVRPKLEKWADVFRKMREIDGVPAEDFALMLDFVRTDSFWGPNAVSVECLRSRSDKNGLLKHENLRSAMRAPQTKKHRSGTALDPSYFENLPMEDEKWT